MNYPNIAFIRPEVLKLRALYIEIKDALEGEPSVKEKTTQYLPSPTTNPEKHDIFELDVRYERYLSRAVFVNYSSQHIESMAGRVFTRPPILSEMPTGLEDIIGNADGGGKTLTQMAKKALDYNLAYSRGGILIDYPETDKETLTKKDLKDGFYRPILEIISPLSMINWRTKSVGAKVVLTMLVICEAFNHSDDGFEYATDCQFRVLRLNESGHYVQDVWRKEQNANDRWDGVSIPNSKGYKPAFTYVPTDHYGKPFSEIPFVFFGAKDNDVNPDHPKFHNIVSLNYAHYRNYAAYEDSCITVGQPTPVVSGVSKDWVESVMGGSIMFGSSTGIALPVGAKAEFIQANESTMLMESMKLKEDQMKEIGAKMIESHTVRRTATEASIDEINEGSELTIITENVSSAITLALKIAAKWVGHDENVLDKVDFKLNTDYNIGAQSADDIRMATELWEKKAITWDEYRDVLSKAGITKVSSEEAYTQIKSELEAMGLLNPIVEKNNAVDSTIVK